MPYKLNLFGQNTQTYRLCQSWVNDELKLKFVMYWCYCLVSIMRKIHIRLSSQFRIVVCGLATELAQITNICNTPKLYLYLQIDSERSILHKIQAINGWLNKSMQILI